ncbi:hypothetical protein LCGC14_0284290 [marine sediment metagenome]|uniref:Uncharacterized protein n=1 Tax=marine sediment metagenome TaxID=412755 RepID=A0A0F9U031_9ZZZZ|nr:hypothetical protein [Phycisphaerae bacterium]HDZ43930.1 hypothetical protein [Phycisphaerae bacterium]
MRMLCTLSAVVLLVGNLAAQQDSRVQTGNVLDANPQIGSSGANTPVRTYRPVNSQLYVTGQVTGLSRFRGSVGYFAPDQLNLTLPGEDIRTFRARSVGLRQVTSGLSPYRTHAYLDRAQTVLKARAIASGAAATGTNVPLHSTLSPQVAAELFSQATRPYRAMIEPVSRTASTAMPPVGREALAPAWISAQQVRTPDRFEDVDRPGATALFALPWYGDREELVRQLRRQRDRDELDEDDARLGSRTEARLDAELYSEDGGPMDVSLDRGIPPPAVTAMPDPGEDIFHDLLVELRRRQLQLKTGTDTDQPDEDAEDSEDDEYLIVLTTLGGRHRDYFNDFMTKGDRALKDGRYYDAALEYRGALSVNPKNPLARLGAALALFGAGESYTAALHLRRAMALFPPLMETRLDIPSLMDPVTFDERLKAFKLDLKEDSQKLERPEPLLLAAYLHMCVGERLEARHYAHRLRAVAGRDEVYLAYARFVLTGKRPDEPDDETPVDKTPAEGAKGPVE